MYWRTKLYHVSLKKEDDSLAGRIGLFLCYHRDVTKPDLPGPHRSVIQTGPVVTLLQAAQGVRAGTKQW